MKAGQKFTEVYADDIKKAEEIQYHLEEEDRKAKEFIKIQEQENKLKEMEDKLLRDKKKFIEQEKNEFLEQERKRIHKEHEVQLRLKELELKKLENENFKREQYLRMEKEKQRQWDEYQKIKNLKPETPEGSQIQRYRDPYLDKQEAMDREIAILLQKEMDKELELQKLYDKQKQDSIKSWVEQTQNQTKHIKPPDRKEKDPYEKSISHKPPKIPIPRHHSPLKILPPQPSEFPSDYESYTSKSISEKNPNTRRYHRHTQGHRTDKELEEFMKDFINREVNVQGLKKLNYRNICNEPIHPSIPKKKLPHRFEFPKIEPFKGKEDPKEHLRKFTFSSYQIANDDSLMLRIFPMTLAGQALDWYNSLPMHSLYTFEQLANQFLEHFRINIKEKSSITDLTRLQQFPDETIQDYISRWRVVLTSMPYTIPQEELVKLFSQSCLRPIASILQIQQHRTFEEAIAQAVIIERVKIQDGELKLKKKEYKKGNQYENTSKQPQNNQIATTENSNQPSNIEEKAERKPKRNFTPLSEPLSEILKKLCDNGMITLPDIKPENPNAKGSKWYKENEFCAYHRQKGHNTNKCRTLQHKIQDLIDSRKIDVDNPVVPSNQNLGIYQNPLPTHQANNVATIPNQMNYTWNNKDIPFIGTIDDSIHMIGIATRAQQYQNKQDNP